MRFLAVFVVALFLSGCLRAGDDVDSLQGVGSGLGDAGRIPFEHSLVGSTDGAWSREANVAVSVGWRGLEGFLDLSDYVGWYDLELVSPDGTVRDTCGPTPGCQGTMGGGASVTHGGSAAADVRHGTWTVRAWGEGVGDYRVGLRAEVLEGSLVPTGRDGGIKVAAGPWSTTYELEVPEGGRDLRAALDLTAYSGFWSMRVVAPDGSVFGTCSDGCGPTVVNNNGGQFARGTPAPGTWLLEVEGEGSGRYAVRLHALVPAGATA